MRPACARCVVPPAANAAPEAASWHEIVVAPDLRFSPRCFVFAAASEWCRTAQRSSSRFWRESGYMQSSVLGPVLASGSAHPPKCGVQLRRWENQHRLSSLQLSMLFIVSRNNYSSGTSLDGGRRHIEFYKNAILGRNEPHMASVYLHIKFYTNIFIGHQDMAQKYKSKMADVAILKFVKNWILGYGNTCMTNVVYQKEYPKCDVSSSLCRHRRQTLGACMLWGSKTHRENYAGTEHLSNSTSTVQLSPPKRLYFVH